jgi:hypothetical protein
VPDFETGRGGSGMMSPLKLLGKRSGHTRNHGIYRKTGTSGKADGLPHGSCGHLDRLCDVWRCY